jgi:alcohol dehydrogenase
MADTVYKLDPEIVIGRDTINRAGSLIGSHGRKILIATEQGLYENNQIGRLTGIIEEAGIEAIIFDEISAQAAADTAENIASLARGARCDLILGFGGLKTQYIARLVCILAVSRFGLFDLLDGEKEESAFLPYAAIPTAGGDPFLFSDLIIAVDPRDRLVKMIQCPRRLCRVVIFDPFLSDSLSGKFASSSAFDGLCVSLEAYCSNKSSFLSDAFLEQAISAYARIIYSYAENNLADVSADLCSASCLMALGASASAPGIGTALAYAINGRFPVAKSWSAAVLLPYIMEKLVAANPEKMAKAAALMGETTEAVSTADAANMAVETVRRLMGRLSVPARLKDFNLSLDKLVSAAEAARSLEFAASSPWTISSEEAYDLLKQAF